MRPSSQPSNITSSPLPADSHAPQPQDDHADDEPDPEPLLLHPHPDDNHADELDGTSTSEDESVDDRRSAALWSPAGQPSPPAPMTADPVVVGAAAGAVHRPGSSLPPQQLRQPCVEDDDMTDASSDTDSDDEIELDAGGGASLSLAASSAMATAAANARNSHVDYNSESDSEYDSEDDYIIEANSHYNQPPVTQTPFSMIPIAAHQMFVAGQHHSPPQTPSQHHALNSDASTDNPGPHHFQLQTHPDINLIPELANLPPLPQPPPDWVPLPPILGDPMPDVFLSNANPSILGSENFGLVDFLRDWAYQGRFGRAARTRPPHLDQVVHQAQETPDEIGYSDLKGDSCDLQGLDWSAMETTRQAARLRRQYTYRNYVNRQGSDKWASQLEGARTSPNGSFFRFKRMNIRKDISLAHFQLRSVLACPTRTHAYYPSTRGITRLNTASRKSDLAMNLHDFPANGAVISTLDAACGVLVCGTFSGDYCIKSLNSSDKQGYVEGRITDDMSGITNHIKIHTPRRSAGPVAAIASNDHGFRLLDLETQKITQETMYPFALNCTALSPDRRLRAVVGDDFNVFITNADTGEVQRELSGHRDYGFACDWSDDGWTVATGFQDMAVKIWDARRWCNSSGVSTPLCTVRTEMAGARSLRFSPIGGGRPVLVAAEEADYVNIIDAKTFRRKQLVDVFGEIGGVSFANDGHDLNVLCCDSHRGGLLQLERCGRDFAPSGETPAHEMPSPF